MFEIFPEPVVERNQTDQHTEGNQESRCHNRRLKDFRFFMIHEPVPPFLLSLPPPRPEGTAQHKHQETAHEEFQEDAKTHDHDRHDGTPIIPQTGVP
jgi:hypothetical protein